MNLSKTVLWIIIGLCSLCGCKESYVNNPGQGAKNYTSEAYREDLNLLLLTSEDEKLGLSANFFIGLRRFANLPLELKGNPFFVELQQFQIDSKTYSKIDPTYPFILRNLHLKNEILSASINPPWEAIKESRNRHLENLKAFQVKYSQPYRLRETNGNIKLYFPSEKFSEELKSQLKSWEDLEVPNGVSTDK